MNAQKKFKLALVGTDSLRGKEIKNVLARRKLAAFDIEFYDADVQAEYSRLTQFRKEPKVIYGLKEESLEGKDIIFLAADKETNRRFGSLAAKHNVRAIDLSETFNLDEEIPLLVAGVNDDVLDHGRAPLIANPHPVTVFLAHFFNLILPEFGVSKAVAFILQPVSAFDDAGVQELASQSVALLNGSPPAKKVFKQQIAFNLLSHTEKPDAGGFCSSERQIAVEIKRVLRRPEFPLSLSIIQTPVFHTYSLMTYCELEKDAEIEALESLFKENPLFKMAAFRDGCSVSSISVSGKDEIFVGQIKRAEQFPRAFWFWLVADNLTRGSALNAFEIAKKILAAGRSS
jgi:aspartate-semialdehyde dehydrogenase